MAKKKKSPKVILKDKLEDLAKKIAKARDGYVCQWCGAKVEGSNAHGSHLIPKSKGDAHRWNPKNIVCHCYHCHLNVWHKSPVEASNWLKGYKKSLWKWVELHTWDTVKDVHPLKMAHYTLDEMTEMKEKLTKKLRKLEK